MRCKFEIGQRVACVADRGLWFDIGSGERMDGPGRGDVCKVVDLKPSRLTYQDDGGSIVGVRVAGWPGMYYADRCFRPLSQRPKKASIEVFRKLLSSTKVTEPA